MIVGVACSPSVDVTYVVDDFGEGAQVRPIGIHRVAGGKTLNAARAAALLGASVHVVAPLGGGSGAFLEQRLAADGVPFTAVPAARPTRQCISIASLATGSLTEIYETAPSIADAWGAVIEAAGSRLREAGPGTWLMVSGSIPDTGTAQPLAELADLAARSGARLAVDTHGASLQLALTLSPALVKVNREEAEAALGAEAGVPAVALAERIHRISGGLAVVTDGASGSAAADGGIGGELERWTVALPEVHGDYPVGSGDSYLGGLLAALEHGDPPEHALRQATAAATANALVPGAAVFDAHDVRALRSRVELVRI